MRYLISAFNKILNHKSLIKVKLCRNTTLLYFLVDIYRQLCWFYYKLVNLTKVLYQNPQNLSTVSFLFVGFSLYERAECDKADYKLPLIYFQLVNLIKARQNSVLCAQSFKLINHFKLYRIPSVFI